MKRSQLFSNRNIILVITLVFGVWVFFFDQNNYHSSMELNRKIDELEAEKAYYRKQISEDSAVIEGLKDSVFVEKFAREHFLMKRSNELIYLLDEDSTGR